MHNASVAGSVQAGQTWGEHQSKCTHLRLQHGPNHWLIVFGKANPVMRKIHTILLGAFVFANYPVIEAAEINTPPCTCGSNVRVYVDTRITGVRTRPTSEPTFVRARVALPQADARRHRRVAVWIVECG
jgi:hypothetical protein